MTKIKATYISISRKMIKWLVHRHEETFCFHLKRYLNLLENSVFCSLLFFKLPLISCVFLGKWHNLSGPFIHLQKGIKMQTTSNGFLVKTCNMWVNWEQYLAHSKHLTNISYYIYIEFYLWEDHNKNVWKRLKVNFSQCKQMSSVGGTMDNLWLLYFIMITC